VQKQEQKQMICHSGEMRKVYIEIVTERFGDRVISSNVRPATDDDIAKLSQQKCDHTTQVESVVYAQLADVMTGYYTVRCAVCGEFLGRS